MIRRLLELIEALERRVPRLGVGGEIRIAHEATTLKQKALERTGNNMKKFTRERVVPTISASISCESFGSTRWGFSGLP